MSGRPAVEFGQYVVYEELGAGGMATVHRAELHGIAGFRRQVALKRLLPSIAAQPELVQAFIDEARVASKLQHANIAQTFDLGKVGEIYFIAMEYIAGPTLMQVIRQCIAAAGAIPMSIALHILTEIADALHHAHNLVGDHGVPAGVIHRDVSPSNIMISSTGVVKLIDFGIAKAMTSEMRTQTGIIKGKFGYIAPEYIEGRIDSRADLFGFGVIAHEMLTTRMLFQHKDDLETLNRVQTMPIDPPSRWNRQVPPDLDDIVMTALARNPDRRWQTAAALRTALINLSRSGDAPVSGQHVAHWLEWAFSQVPGRVEGPIEDAPSGLERAIASLAEPSRLVEVIDSLGDVSSKVVFDPPTGATTLVPVGRRGRATRLVLLLILLAVTAGAAAAWYFGLVPMPFAP